LLQYVLQPAGTNAVGSLLIFLNLLERQSKPVRKVCLAHFEHQAAHAHAASNVLVDEIAGLLRAGQRVRFLSKSCRRRQRSSVAGNDPDLPSTVHRSIRDNVGNPRPDPLLDTSSAMASSVSGMVTGSSPTAKTIGIDAVAALAASAAVSPPAAITAT
jgi:hypothetical protein